MKLYRTKLPYFGGFAGEQIPRWPQDYEEPEEIEQRGAGQEALDNAFAESHYAGNGIRLGDVVGLDSGGLFRCEMSGWTDIGKMWTAKIHRGHGRSING
jgi:hypothetical protein